MSDLPFLKPNSSIVLYGETGHGKSTQAAKLAKHIFKEFGKKTVVFLADEQGSGHAYDENPAVERIITPTGNKWLWVGEAFQNRYQGKPAWTDETGLVIQEGLTSYAYLVLDKCAEFAGEGVNIGGGGAHNVTLFPEDIPYRVDGEGKIHPKGSLTTEQRSLIVHVGSNNMTHFGTAQEAVRNGLKAVRGSVPTLFTAMEGLAKPKANAPNTLGPATVGDAQVRAIPPLVTYTFRIVQEGGKVTLHLKPHTAGTRTQALVNPRIPEEGASVRIPDSITPASLPEAMTLLHRRRTAARDEILGGKG